jgi:hypothetical protein
MLDDPDKIWHQILLKESELYCVVTLASWDAEDGTHENNMAFLSKKRKQYEDPEKTDHQDNAGARGLLRPRAGNARFRPTIGHY